MRIFYKDIQKKCSLWIVVFLLAVKMTTKFEIRRTKQFYKDFLQLTDNDENMEAIKKMGSTLDIYQYFIR